MSENKKKIKIVNYKRFALVTFTLLVTTIVLIFGGLYFYLASLNNSAVDLSKKNTTSNLSKDEIEKLVNDW